MAGFTMTVAGRTCRVQPLFESTAHYFGAYLSQLPPDFSVTVQPQDLVFEQEMLDREAVEEGFRFRKFTDPFLERAAICRAFAEELFEQDTLMLHGSVVVVEEEAYLFTARSGTGKSTHTRLWCQAFGDRAAVINDDKPFLRCLPEQVLACGSPWSGKHGLDQNRTVPLRGICILERGRENIISPMVAADALPMLLKQGYCPLEEAKQLSYTQKITALAHRIPLWHMRCNKDPQAAVVAYSAMSKAGR